MTKAQLIDTAGSLGISVSSGSTKAEIIAKILAKEAE